MIDQHEIEDAGNRYSGTYKNIAYVKAQTEKLAEQLATRKAA